MNLIMKTSIKFYPSSRSTKCAIQAALDVYERLQPLSDEIVGVTPATFEQPITPFKKPQPQIVGDALWSHQYQIATVLVHGNLSLPDVTLFRTQAPTIQELGKQIRKARYQFDFPPRKRGSRREAEHFCHMIQAIPETQNVCGLVCNWVQESTA